MYRSGRVRSGRVRLHVSKCNRGDRCSRRSRRVVGWCAGVLGAGFRTGDGHMVVGGRRTKTKSRETITKWILVEF